MTNETFTTVAVFQYSAEAQIIKGRLESDGIKVFLTDNLTIDTDPLVSRAIGGVKLKVLSYQVSEAREILKSIKQYSVNDDGDAIHCPNCKSTHIEMFSTIKNIKLLFWFLLGMLFNTLPFSSKYKYRCEMCDTEFGLQANIASNTMRIER